MPKGFASEEPTTSAIGVEPFPYGDIKTEELQIKQAPFLLPIGIYHQGRRLTSFKLKPYTGAEELQLSALNKRYQSKVAEVLPRFAAEIIDSFGDDQGSISLKELATSQNLSTMRLCENMHLADALTILLQARLDSYGAEIQLAGQCPNCATHNRDKDGEFSLIDTVDVIFVKQLLNPIIEISLKGTMIAQEMITRIQIRPIRVYDLKRIQKQSSNEQELEITYELLTHSCVAIPESTFYGETRNTDNSGVSPGSAEEIFAKLDVDDREDWKDAVKSLGDWGPSMKVPMNCRACGHEYPAAVPWNNLPFFLSRPSRKRNR